jgi:LytS/YehU family sensor histidine kinase
VTHGIAGLVEGGAITIETRRNGSRVAITIENPCDPDRRQRSGTGVGLENARQRLSAAYGSDARLSAAEAEGRYRVELWLPADTGYTAD